MGDYARLVRQHFQEALNVRNFLSIYDMEFFDLKVLEQKGNIQEKLFTSMISEPNLGRILEISPFTNIRAEAYHYIEDKVSAVSSLRHTFQRDIMEGSLHSFIIDLNQNGRNAEIYRAFYSHFVDKEFRQTFGLPLP